MVQILDYFNILDVDILPIFQELDCRWSVLQSSKALQVVITDGPLPDLAAAALRADGLSILEAQDELQAFCIIWPCFDRRRRNRDEF